MYDHSHWDFLLLVMLKNGVWVGVDKFDKVVHMHCMFFVLANGTLLCSSHSTRELRKEILSCPIYL